MHGNAPRSVEAIDEAVIAGAIVLEHPHHVVVDAAGGVALGARKARRRRVELGHAEDGSHGPEPANAQLRAAAVLRHVLGVEHGATEQVARPRHHVLWVLGQWLAAGQHLDHEREVEGAAERHPRRRLAPARHRRQQGGELAREVRGRDAVRARADEVEALRPQEVDGLDGVRVAGDVEVGEVELPRDLQREAVHVHDDGEVALLVADGEPELQDGELLHVGLDDRVVARGRGQPGPRGRAVHGARVLGVYRDVAEPGQQRADEVHLGGEVGRAHGHELEAAHHRRGRDHGSRRREHGGGGGCDLRGSSVGRWPARTTRARGLRMLTCLRMDWRAASSCGLRRGRRKPVVEPPAPAPFI
jgi:hypothetical protein